MELKDPKVIKVFKERKEPPALRDLLDKTVSRSKENPDNLVYPEPPDLKVSKEKLAPRVLPDHKEGLALPVLRVLRVLTEKTEPPDEMVTPVQLVILVPTDLPEFLVLTAPKVKLVVMVFLVLMVPKVLRVPVETKEMLVSKVFPELLD